MTASNDVVMPVESKLRIEFIHRPTGFFIKSHPFPVQHIPFKYGIRVTNVGDIAFKGAVIKGFSISMIGSDIVTESSKEPEIKSLNPGETIDLYFDEFTSIHAGSIWISCKLVPLVEANVIESYQYDGNHRKDNPVKTKNSWGNSYFIQGRMELLQSHTNSLIVLLTAITVLEAVIGLAETIKYFLGLLSSIFSFLGGWFGSFVA